MGAFVLRSLFSLPIPQWRKKEWTISVNTYGTRCERSEVAAAPCTLEIFDMVMIVVAFIGLVVKALFRPGCGTRASVVSLLLNTHAIMQKNSTAAKLIEGHRKGLVMIRHPVPTC